MNKAVFITGTDTGVGKTFVSLGLIRAMRVLGLSVCPMKPVETGCRNKKGELIPEDAVNLINASGVDEPLDIINPYRFSPPLAPSVAAEIEGKKIERKKIFSAFKKLSPEYDLLIVEGAGGIMVPVYKKYLFLDLAGDLNLPVIIVARPGLGTINHTLLTIDAARNRGLNVLGVIINYADATRNRLAEKTNPGVIERVGGVPLLGIVRHSKNPASGNCRRLFAKITEHILSSL